MAAIVVSDSSPLRALSRLGLLPVLPRLFERIVVPSAVVREIEVPVAGTPLVRIADHAFLEVRSPTNIDLVPELTEVLGAGEAEAIVIAGELSADYVLIDESTGRRIAKERGLSPMGVLGVLVRAKAAGQVDALRPLIDQLDRDLRFRMSASIVKRVLEDAGEG